MNYQKFLEKLRTYDKITIEKFRVIFILFFTLVFGVVLQNVIFSRVAAEDAKSVSDNRKENDVKIKYVAIASETIQSAGTTPEAGNTRPEVIIEEPIKQEDQNHVSNYAVTSEPNPNFLPIRNYDMSDIELNAKAAIAITETGKILHKRNIDQKVAIASLTKVAAALAVLEHTKPDEEVVITQNAVNTEGAAGQFIVGEKLKVKDMLKIMLMISSNDAAAALEDHLKVKGLDIVVLMNEKVKELGLQNTNFENAIGLDADEHYSSAKDYADLVIYAIRRQPMLLEIFSEKSALLNLLESGGRNRKIISNHQLTHDKDLNNIIGGKTGFTQNAGGCLLTIFNTVKENGEAGEKVITVVLGADDITSRFEESKNLINWINSAYIF